jgi:hypothetical protein
MKRKAPNLKPPGGKNGAALPCLEYQIAGELQWPWRRGPVIAVLFLSEIKESGQEKSGID